MDRKKGRGMSKAMPLQRPLPNKDTFTSGEENRNYERSTESSAACDRNIVCVWCAAREPAEKSISAWIVG